MQPTACRALLTGASGGIGLALAYRLPAKALHLLLVAVAWSSCKRSSSAIRNRFSGPGRYRHPRRARCRWRRRRTSVG